MSDFTSTFEEGVSQPGRDVIRHATGNLKEAEESEIEDYKDLSKDIGTVGGGMAAGSLVLPSVKDEAIEKADRFEAQTLNTSGPADFTSSYINRGSDMIGSDVANVMGKDVSGKNAVRVARGMSYDPSHYEAFESGPQDALSVLGKEVGEGYVEEGDDRFGRPIQEVQSNQGLSSYFDNELQRAAQQNGFDLDTREGQEKAVRKVLNKDDPVINNFNRVFKEFYGDAPKGYKNWLFTPSRVYEGARKGAGRIGLLAGGLGALGYGGSKMYQDNMTENPASGPDGPTQKHAFMNNFQPFIKSSGGPGSGKSRDSTDQIKELDKSPLITLHKRKKIINHRSPDRKTDVKLDRISYGAQTTYDIEKLGWMLGHFEEWKDEPIQVARVNGEYHLMDGHHRFLAATRLDETSLPAEVWVMDENEVRQITGQEKKAEEEDAEKSKETAKGIGAAMAGTVAGGALAAPVTFGLRESTESGVRSRFNDSARQSSMRRVDLENLDKEEVRQLSEAQNHPRQKVMSKLVDQKPDSLDFSSPTEMARKVGGPGENEMAKKQYKAVGPGYIPTEQSMVNVDSVAGPSMEGSPEIAAHEMGHHDIHKLLGNSYYGSAAARKIPPLALAGGMVGYFRNRKDNPQRAKKYRDGSLGVAGAGTGLTLADEGAASVIGDQKLQDAIDASDVSRSEADLSGMRRGLGKAMGTYGIGMIAPIAAMGGIYAADSYGVGPFERESSKADERVSATKEADAVIAGKTYYSTLNDETVTIEGVGDNTVEVSDGNATWTERPDAVREKIREGDWEEASGSGQKKTATKTNQIANLLEKVTPNLRAGKGSADEVADDAVGDVDMGPVVDPDPGDLSLANGNSALDEGTDAAEGLDKRTKQLGYGLASGGGLAGAGYLGTEMHDGSGGVTGGSRVGNLNKMLFGASEMPKQGANDSEKEAAIPGPAAGALIGGAGGAGINYLGQKARMRENEDVQEVNPYSSARAALIGAGAGATGPLLFRQTNKLIQNADDTISRAEGVMGDVEDTRKAVTESAEEVAETARQARGAIDEAEEAGGAVRDAAEQTRNAAEQAQSNRFFGMFQKESLNVSSFEKEAAKSQVADAFVDWARRTDSGSPDEFQRFLSQNTSLSEPDVRVRPTKEENPMNNVHFRGDGKGPEMYEVRTGGGEGYVVPGVGGEGHSLQYNDRLRDIADAPDTESLGSVTPLPKGETVSTGGTQTEFRVPKGSRRVSTTPDYSHVADGLLGGAVIGGTGYALTRNQQGKDIIPSGILPSGENGAPQNDQNTAQNDEGMAQNAQDKNAENHGTIIVEADALGTTEPGFDFNPGLHGQGLDFDFEMPDEIDIDSPKVEEPSVSSGASSSTPDPAEPDMPTPDSPEPEVKKPKQMVT